jgi:RNA polymerase sigma-70 factor (ECF subfamily)
MNLSIDHLRKRKHRNHAEFDEMRGSSGGAQVVRLHSKPDDPSQNVERERMYRTIMDAVDTLPEDQRAVLVLREIEDMPYKEIAEVLDVPEGTVMSRLYYARRRLQVLLAEHRPNG